MDNSKKIYIAFDASSKKIGIAYKEGYGQIEYKTISDWTKVTDFFYFNQEYVEELHIIHMYSPYNSNFNVKTSRILASLRGKLTGKLHQYFIYLEKIVEWEHNEQSVFRFVKESLTTEEKVVNPANTNRQNKKDLTKLYVRKVLKKKVFTEDEADAIALLLYHLEMIVKKGESETNDK